MQDPTFFLRDLVVLFALAIIVVIACFRIRVPAMVGFLITGVLAGPNAFQLIHDPHSVELLAEVGVVLLLFTIGLEFSMESLLRLRSILFLGGGLQVAVTGAFSAVVAGAYFDLPVAKATFLGILVALSSTAIVLKLLSDKAEIDSPQGRVSLGILIFQDLCVVPIVIIMPILATHSGGEEGGGGTADILRKLVMAALLLGGSLLSGRYLVPWVLGQVVRTRSREAFLLAIIILCLGTAWVSSLAGLSLALGAFIAGLIISQSEYSHQALGEIIPFRDTFNCLFLISIGMLLDLKLFSSPWPLLLGVTAMVGVKTLVAWGVTLVLGYSFRIAVITGLCLAQVGEFSFVLAKQGKELKLIDVNVYQLFLAGAVITMILTPLLKGIAPWLADKLTPLVPKKMRTSKDLGTPAQVVEVVKDHVVIIGYGLNGRNLAKALKRVAIPFVIIEMNPETVKKERKEGVPIIYGDASNPEILDHAGIRRARVLVIAVSDPSSIRRSTELARRLHPGLHIIVRTRYLGEMKPLLALGANEVVPEEFETALEIFSRTLRKLLVPRDMVERFVREARVDGYGALLAPADGERSSKEKADALSVIAGADLEVLRVEEGSPLAGKTLEEANLRRQTGATVLALRCGAEFQSNPPVTAVLSPGSVAIVFGTPDQVAKAAKLMRG